MSDMKYHGVGPIGFESVSAVTATPSVDLGTRVEIKGEEYIYCYNAGGADVYPTYGVKLITACTGYSVANTALTDVVNMCVGVVKHSTIAAGSYGWVMSRGFSQLEYHPNSTTTGDYVAYALGVGGIFTQCRPLTDAVGVGTFAVAALGLSVNTASGGSFYGFVKCGF